MAGAMFPESRAGRLALAALFGVLIWIEPELWVLPAVMLLGALMCVFRVRGQPMAEAAAASLGGAALVQLWSPAVGILAVALAASLSSLWEAPVARVLRKRGWLGEVREREVRGESATGTNPAGAGIEGDPPLRLRSVPGKYRVFALGAAAGMTLGLIFLLSFVFFVWNTIPRPQPPGAGELRPAPIPSRESVGDFDWKLLGLDGEEVSVSARSGKVLFVNRWATWCRPCIAELPGIQELTRKVPGEEVAWLPISDEPLPVVLKFAREQEWKLPLYVAVNGTPTPFEGSSIPTTFIVDREGRIVFRHVGAVDWDTPAVVRFLTNLIEE